VVQNYVAQTLFRPFTRKSGARMGPVCACILQISFKHRQECLCHIANEEQSHLQPQISRPHHFIAEKMFGFVRQQHSAVLDDVTTV
jgi:hypothetical protein